MPAPTGKEIGRVQVSEAGKLEWYRVWSAEGSSPHPLAPLHLLLGGLMLSLCAQSSDAAAESVSSLMVGTRYQLAAKPADTITSIAAYYGISRRQLASDNRLRETARLKSGQKLILDNRHIVPVELADGLVVNIPQRMLYLMRGGQIRKAFPIAAGKADWRTPTGVFRVTSLQTDKPWIIPESIKAEMRQLGKTAIDRVPPGPDNPLGRHWIGLSLPNIGIHGTIAPLSIYQFASHGCIRMHPDDVASLFGELKIGDRGVMVYQPVLLSKLSDGRVFLEVNPDVYQQAPDGLNILKSLAAKAGLTEVIDWPVAARVLARADGIAREIGRGKEPTERTDVATR